MRIKGNCTFKKLITVFDTENSINVSYHIIIVITIVITNVVALFISLQKPNLIFAQFQKCKNYGNRIDSNAFGERYITSHPSVLRWEDNTWNHLF